MIELLLLISFFIHITTFIYLKTLSSRVMRPEEFLQRQEEQKKEMEDLLSIYVLEIREENERLMEALQNKPNNRDNQSTTASPQRSSLSNQGKEQMAHDTKRAFYYKQNDYEPPMIEEEESFKPSFSAQVLALYSKGESVESIARKLDCGKTEVELMVKFHQKNG
ncbi:hypothetical protein [Paraliobacillus sp. PM-2]|uniref:DUF6115 domain-containing protein n=1 Tax=Paraliobacillus sp. PM-2 TaxID=1462524 RepID=UPI000B822A2A|nr:hypothetical protein [Paraliobacillus sp. PM-2]